MRGWVGPACAVPVVVRKYYVQTVPEINGLIALDVSDRGPRKCMERCLASKRAFIAVTVALGLAGACSNPEQQFIADCEASGMQRELCDCLLKHLPPERREALLSVPDNVGGEWVLPSDMAPALSCFDVGVMAG